MNAASICARAAELIDRLERHKAALQGESDLKIGLRTTILDYEDSLAVLSDAYAFIRDNHIRRPRDTPTAGERR